MFDLVVSKENRTFRYIVIKNLVLKLGELAMIEIFTITNRAAVDL